MVISEHEITHLSTQCAHGGVGGYVVKWLTQ